MSNDPANGSDKERGEATNEGFGQSDRPKPAQDSSIDPKLAPPAEGEQSQTRDDGLGPSKGNDRIPDRPVPPGDPSTESDRTDNQ